MTSSSYPSEPFLLGLSQTILGGAWRPKTFRKITKPPGNWLDGLTARGLAELREELAIKWLAARPDLRTAKRDDHKPDCIRKFRITGRGYQRVWRAARKLAGLTEHASPGPKKKK